MSRTEFNHVKNTDWRKCLETYMAAKTEDDKHFIRKLLKAKNEFLFDCKHGQARFK